MNTPKITEKIAREIIRINNHIQNNEFEKLNAPGYINHSKAEYLRRAFLDYFDNDNHTSDFARISTPSRDHIVNNSVTLYSDPRNPSPKSWMIESDVIIDDQRSDLTAIYLIGECDSPEKVELYAVLTQ